MAATPTAPEPAALPGPAHPTGPPGPLTGFTVGVAAARRREELTALPTRRGAQVVEAPVLRILPLADDLDLRKAPPPIPPPLRG